MRCDYDTYFYFRVEYKVHFFDGVEYDINTVVKVFDSTLRDAFFKVLAFSEPVHRITYLGCVIDDGLNYFEPSDISGLSEVPDFDEYIGR